MAYRRIETGIWKDPWFESLDHKARYLFLYLWTNDMCNQAGLYEISIKRMMFETCLSEREIESAFLALSEKVSRIGTWIWVKNFLRYQCCNESFQKKAILEAGKAPRKLYEQFCTYNSIEFQPEPHTPHTPVTHPSSDTDTDTDTDTEAVTEQKQIETSNEVSCAEPCRDSTPVAPPVVEIPTNLFQKSGEQFGVTQALLEEYQRLYPAVDVVQSLHAMRAWAISNPMKRKTSSGMLRFVNSWLAREQNGAGNGRHPPDGKAEKVGRAGRVAMNAFQQLAQMREEKSDAGTG